MSTAMSPAGVAAPAGEHQLAMPMPDPAVAPHGWRPATDGAQLGPCRGCDRHRLDPVHRQPSHGAALFFDALDRVDRDNALTARRVIRRCRDDIARLCLDPEQTEHFRAGASWGHAALGMVDAALAGERDPDRLSFTALRRRALRRRTR